MAVRLLAVLFTLVALAGVALAGMELRRVLTGSDPGMAAAPEPEGAGEPQPPAASGTAPTRWPALFGQPQPPQPPQPPAPAPATPPAPPVASLGYTLKGMVALGGETWAILSHPTGERILRVGDLLVDGVRVVAIDEAGLWVETARGREVLEFVE